MAIESPIVAVHAGIQSYLETTVSIANDYHYDAAGRVYLARSQFDPSEPGLLPAWALFAYQGAWQQTSMNRKKADDTVDMSIEAHLLPANVLEPGTEINNFLFDLQRAMLQIPHDTGGAKEIMFSSSDYRLHIPRKTGVCSIEFTFQTQLRI